MKSSFRKWDSEDMEGLTVFFLAGGLLFGSLLCVAFSSCSEEGLLFVAVRRLLIAVASLVAERGLQ